MNPNPSVTTTFPLQVFLPGWGGHVYGGGSALGRRPALSPPAERPLFREHCQTVRVWTGPGPGLPPQQAHYSQVSFLSIYSFSSYQLSAIIYFLISLVSTRFNYNLPDRSFLFVAWYCMILQLQKSPTFLTRESHLTRQFTLCCRR